MRSRMCGGKRPDRASPTEYTAIINDYINFISRYKARLEDYVKAGTVIDDKVKQRILSEVAKETEPPTPQSDLNWVEQLLGPTLNAIPHAGSSVPDPNEIDKVIMDLTKQIEALEKGSK